MAQVVVLLFMVVPLALSGQNAMELLDRVQARGRSLTTFEMDAVSIQEWAFTTRTDTTIIYRHLYGASGKLRLESDSGRVGKGRMKTVLIYDGEHAWTYNSGTHTYTRVAGSQATGSDLHGSV